MTPLKQFEIHRIIPIKLFGLDLSFTNASLFMVLAVIIPLVFFRLTLRRMNVMPSRSQAMGEAPFNLLGNFLEGINAERGRPFLPLFFALFLFVFMGNFMGLLPYAFTFTSQFVINIALAGLILSIITCVGFVYHGSGFLRLFLPHGVPWWVAPILVPVEVVSYLARPVSLAIRLFANMTAGHIMMKVFGYFTLWLGVIGVFPLLVNVSLTMLEFFIAIIQACVFTILSSIYLHDALYLH